MSLLSGTDTYWKFTGQCASCGRCTQSCTSLSSAGMTLGEIARTMNIYGDAADSQETLAAWVGGNPSLVQAVRGCFLCTSCQSTCFASNNVSELIYAARKDFQNLGLIPRSAWSSVLVDEEWDIFTAYRAIHGIGYQDLIRHISSDCGPAQTDCQVAFFPGCSLAAYGPELTREVFGAIEHLGGKTTMIDHCCGSPLKSAGFYERAEALLDKIADEVQASGAKTVVCVCPGCCNAVKATLARRGMDVEAVAMSSFLLQHDFQPAKDLSQMDLCLSKSCQDRNGLYMEDLMKVMGLAQDTKIIYGGCCGAGGAVSAYDYNRQSMQVDRKLSEVGEGQTVVTLCPTCTYTYAFQQMSAPRNIGNKHYLELLFQNQFDWEAVSARLNGMWTGEYGPWLAQVFA